MSKPRSASYREALGMDKPETTVNGPHQFIEVAEQNRTYIYPHPKLENKTVSVSLEGVKSIHVSASGTHRINLTNGKKRIMPSGWVSIEFDAEKWTF